MVLVGFVASASLGGVTYFLLRPIENPREVFRILLLFAFISIFWFVFGTLAYHVGSFFLRWQFPDGYLEHFAIENS